MNIKESIEKMILKRQIYEVYGNYKYYSKLVKQWTVAVTGEKSTKHKIMSNDDRLEGYIQHYSRKMVEWKIEFDDLKSKLEKLGVRVDLTL